MTESNQYQYDTKIARIGIPKIIAADTGSNKVDDSNSVTLVMTSEELSDLGTDALSMEFEKAGPRANLYFDPSKTTCGIVTCGGLCPGINDVIRSIVLTAHHHYSIPKILGFRNGLRGFIPGYGYDVMKLTPQSVSGIHQSGGTILGTSRDMQDIEKIVDSLEQINLNVLFIIGGLGAMRAANAIVDEINKRGKKISVVGIPKTVDNDINFIARSFGFETAVEKATEAIRSAHVEALSVNHGVGMVKLMGRDAGFIAAEATLATSEVNFLLIPEQPFELEGEQGLLMALERRLLKKKHALIVIAEGAGQEHVDSGKSDLFGNPDLGDISGTLIRRFKSHFKKRNIELYIKYIDPSYIIRSIPATAGDRVYCSFLGQHAVHAAMAGKTGMVVAQVKSSMVHLPLGLITDKRRTLNTRSDYFNAVMDTTDQEYYFKKM